MRADFYAVRDDLEEICAAVEAKHKVVYYPTGLFAVAAVPEGCSGAAMLENKAEAYLVLPQGVSLRKRKIDRHDGTTWFAVDESENSGVTVKPSRLTADGTVLLPGVLGTVASSGEALVLCRAYKAAMRKHFTRVASYWIGAGAMALSKSGVRLTIGVKSPREYDLRVNSDGAA